MEPPPIEHRVYLVLDEAKRQVRVTFDKKKGATNAAIKEFAAKFWENLTEEQQNLINQYQDSLKKKLEKPRVRFSPDVDVAKYSHFNTNKPIEEDSTLSHDSVKRRKKNHLPKKSEALQPLKDLLAKLDRHRRAAEKNQGNYNDFIIDELVAFLPGKDCANLEALYESFAAKLTEQASQQISIDRETFELTALCSDIKMRDEDLMHAPEYSDLVRLLIMKNWPDDENKLYTVVKINPGELPKVLETVKNLFRHATFSEIIKPFT